jgi:hypothetical protein
MIDALSQIDQLVTVADVRAGTIGVTDHRFSSPETAAANALSQPRGQERN